VYVTRKPSKVCTAAIEASGRSRTETLLPYLFKDWGERITDARTTVG